MLRNYLTDLIKVSKYDSVKKVSRQNDRIFRCYYNYAK